MFDPIDNQSVTIRSNYRIDPGVVLIVDTDQCRSNQFKKYLNDIFHVVTVHTGEEAISSFTRDVDVILLGQNIGKWHEHDLLGVIHDRDIDCQVALMSDSEPGLDLAHTPVDNFLKFPVSRGELRVIVTDLHSRRKCTNDHQELLALISRRIALEEAIPRNKLKSSEEFTKLQHRIKITTDRLGNAIQGGVANERVTTNCPKCGMSTSDQLDGQLNFIQLTAWTWKCTNCGCLTALPGSDTPNREQQDSVTVSAGSCKLPYD